MVENQRPTSPSAEITRYLNVENAKLVAFFMTVGFIMYHGIIHAKYGQYQSFYMKIIAVELCKYTSFSSLEFVLCQNFHNNLEFVSLII